jgi:hypothetical protein
MKMLLLGAVGVLALQVLLVVGYLVASRYDPIVLNPERGRLDDSGVSMVMFCGESRTPQGRGSAVLEKIPPNGDVGSWSRGRTVRGHCDIWYHRQIQNGRAGRD